MSGRAVSDVVGFVLMFSVIIVAVAIVATTGFGQLSELSDRERLNAAERGMESFAGSVDDIGRQGALARSIQLAPGGGTIWFNDSEMEVTVTDGTGTVRFDETYRLNSLEHRFDRSPEDVTIAYEGGAVVRSDGGTPRVRPRWRCDQDRDAAVLTLVNLTAGDGLSIGSGYGSGTGDPIPRGDGVPRGDVRSTESTVDVEATHQETVVAYSAVDAGDRTVTVDPSATANPRQWSFALERADGWTAGASDTYDCAGVETVVVRVVTVELSASR